MGNIRRDTGRNLRGLAYLFNEVIKMGKATIVPPEITKEEHENNLKEILDYLQTIADS